MDCKVPKKSILLQAAIATHWLWENRAHAIKADPNQTECVFLGLKTEGAPH